MAAEGPIDVALTGPDSEGKEGAGELAQAMLQLRRRGSDGGGGDSVTPGGTNRARMAAASEAQLFTHSGQCHCGDVRCVGGAGAG